MFRFMIQKLLHKKWMFISLLIGNILLIAFACSYAMYKNASLQRMLTDSFVQYLEEKNSYPFQLNIQEYMKKKANVDEFKNKMEFIDTVSQKFGINEVERISNYYIEESDAFSIIGREDKGYPQKIKISSLSDMIDHINIISGKMYSNKIGDDGFIEAIVSQSTFEELDLIVGEEYEFPELKDKAGNSIKVRITGVFENSLNQDNYWVMSPGSYKIDFFISEDIFQNNFLNSNDHMYSIRGNWYVLLDYTAIKPEQINYLIKTTNKIFNSRSFITQSLPDYISILEKYSTSSKKITATLLVLQVPILSLLFAFIFMISSQMLDMEKNDIALLKSRGSGKRDIILIYVIQSVFVSFISLLLGLPLGAFLCRLLASTSAFLDFTQRRNLLIRLDKEVLFYSMGSVIVSICVMVLPVFRHANVTIVDYKQKKSRNHKPFWQKFYFDVILLGVSLYGLYSYSQQKSSLMEKVLSGSSLEPLLYLYSSLFIISTCLIALRIQSIVVRIVYILGKKQWKPATYASFLQILRTGGKQSFIMVFLMFTIALGIFNSTVARTILSNAEDSIKYNTGADIVISEVWKSNKQQKPERQTAAQVAMAVIEKRTYFEPPFEKYIKLNGVKSLTKVIVNDGVMADIGKSKLKVKLLGINTKEFSKITWFKDNLLPIPYFKYLNLLSSNANAVLLSTNFHDKLQYNVGDSITYLNDQQTQITGIIYGFVDYWPTYEPETKTLKSNGTIETTNNYLIVANYLQVMTKWGLVPYQVWIDAADSPQFIYDFIKEYNLKLAYFKDTSGMLEKLRIDTIFQGTNGILSMSFIVILVLSSTGFLIYWILSIRSRELLFGIFRAMGMTKKEIINILINEQIFSTLLSMIFGTIIGVLVSKLYIPLLQITYSATDQSIPLELVTQSNDMIRLYAIIICTFLLCMIILAKLISKIKISQALKLGED